MARGSGGVQFTPDDVILVGEGGYQFVMDLDSIDAGIRRLIEAAGIIDPTSGRRYTLPAGIAGKKYQMGLSIQVGGIIKFAESLKDLADNVAKKVRLRFIDLAREILLEAVKNAPYETGQLRERGIAKVGGRLVAVGTNSEEGTIDIIPPEKVGWRSDQLTINISFHDEGRDRSMYRNRKTGGVKRRGAPNFDRFLVSVWTHENLEYHPWKAGTGPKYLENAFKKFTPALYQAVTDGVQDGMSSLQFFMRGR